LTPSFGSAAGKSRKTPMAGKIIDQPVGFVTVTDIYSLRQLLMKV
jgi:hypothetical protein